MQNSSLPVSKKVLLIGLDGATFTIINPLLIQGRLPNFKRLVSQGFSSPLISTLPVLTPVAWTSMTTGVSPQNHGIFGFTENNAANYLGCPVSIKSSKAKPLWEILSGAGRKVIVMNVPLTYPPQEVNGLLISGLGSPGDKLFTYPSWLSQEVKEITGHYAVEHTLHGMLNYKNARALLNSIFDLEEKHANLALHLMRKYPWDFFMIVFLSPDRIQDFFWHCFDPRHPRYNEPGAENFREAIFTCYEKIDALIGRLTKEVDKKTSIIIASDHGMGPYDRSFPYLYLNAWLEKKGFLTFLPRRHKFLSWFLEFYLGIRLIFGRNAFTLRLFDSFRLSTSFLRRPLKKKLFSRSIDWSKTKAYANLEEKFSFWVSINLKGRQPQGIVETGKDYQEVTEALKQELENLHHPKTGEPVVRKVYQLPLSKDTPDLLIDWGDEAYFSGNEAFQESSASSDKLALEHPFERPDLGLSGFHRREGICIINAEGVRKEPGPGSLDITGTASLVLYLMGAPVYSDLDNSSLKKVFMLEYLAKNPCKFITARSELSRKGNKVYSEEEAARLKDKLESLGYI